MSENTNQASQPSPKGNGVVSVFTMSMITIAAVLALRNLPSLADYGWTVIFYLVTACIFFFIPSALVSAELASTYPQEGGVYQWVKQAFGPRWGFVAIFMQWVDNLPWFPAALTFVASAIAYVFDPALATNKWFVFSVIMITLWASTFLNFRGIKLSAFLSSSGVIAGTLIPGVIIILLVAVYLIIGDKNQIPFAWDKMVPSLGNFTQLMLFAGMMISLSGMEMSAVHVTEMKNPTINYPKAIFMATIIIIVLSIAGSLAIAIVVPPATLSFAAGVPQAFNDVFKALHMGWLTPILCFLLAYGAITMVVTWVLGPSKGLLEVAKEGYLPQLWQKRNKNNIPTNILLIQAGLSTLLSTVVLFMPNISSAFWMMSALSAQLYMVMYLLMFAAAIRLRYTQPNIKRPYHIPGGKLGMWIVAGIAWLTSLVSIFFGFIPPSNVPQGFLGTTGMTAQTIYVIMLFVLVIGLTAMPLTFYHFYEKKKREEQRQGQ